MRYSLLGIGARLLQFERNVYAGSATRLDVRRKAEGHRSWTLAMIEQAWLRKLQSRASPGADAKTGGWSINKTDQNLLDDIASIAYSLTNTWPVNY